ncbi:hypothetical protein EZS27_030896 [termite gut metagenome]|uniref:Uncharacterized protein n=1 Tax=termite gut metagenome TaxID=433724 RepID=A0A5J4QEZ7_9ZZZZ
MLLTEYQQSIEEFAVVKDLVLLIKYIFISLLKNNSYELSQMHLRPKS